MAVLEHGSNTLFHMGVSVVSDVATLVDPLVPVVAKHSLLRAQSAAGSLAEYARVQHQFMRSTAESASRAAEASAKHVLVATGADRVWDYSLKLKHSAVTLKNDLTEKAVKQYAENLALANKAVNKVAGDATDVVLAYTPKSAIQLIQSAVESVDAVRVDGLGALKGVVPDFVITGTTHTYELFESVSTSLTTQSKETLNSLTSKVHTTTDYLTSKSNETLSTLNDTVSNTKTYLSSTSKQTLSSINAQVHSTTDYLNSRLEDSRGYIVSRVNGTVQYVVQVPAIKTLIIKLSEIVGNEEGIVSRYLPLKRFGIAGILSAALGSHPQQHVDDGKSEASDDVFVNAETVVNSDECDDLEESDVGIEMKQRGAERVGKGTGR